MTSVGPHWMTHALLLFFWPGRFVRKGGLQHSGRCCNRWTSGRSWEFCGRWYRVPHACLPAVFFWVQGSLNVNPILGGGRFQTMQICKYVWRGFGGICLKKNRTCIFFVLVPYNNPRVGSLTMQDNGSTFKWSQRLGGSVIFRCEYFPPVFWLHPWKINGWKLHITHLERKMIFQTCMVMFHVNLQGCSQ